MNEKTINSVTAEFKQARLKMQGLEETRAASATKIEQLTLQLGELRSQRDALEETQHTAPALLVSGKMTDTEFSANKKILAELYSRIDDNTALLAIYEKALDLDYVRQYNELANKIQGMKKFLLLKFSEKLAAEIAKKQDKQIRHLVAVIEGNRDSLLSTPFYHDLGKTLATAVFGELNGVPRPQQADEKNNLIKETFQQLGI